MKPSIRQATPADLPAMVDLLVQSAAQRTALNPDLWLRTADAAGRIEQAVGPTLGGPPTKSIWLLAESAGRIVGIAHAMIVQPPPIYDSAAGSPGLLLDDCFIPPDAPAGTAEALLAATEAHLLAAGAPALIASVPATGPWHALLERQGYEPVTLYMAKTGFAVQPVPPTVRPARAENIPGIVTRSADHRRMLGLLNPRFWHIHKDADSRFDMWMRFSLTLKDRDMFVAGEPVHGYIIAQAISPLLIPAAHDIRTIGVIDDFYDADFASASELASGGTTAADLLSAAESAFAQRDFTTALAVCPAAWTSKASFLERRGYRTAKLWMLKR